MILQGQKSPNHSGVITIRRDPNEVRTTLEALENDADRAPKSPDRLLDRYQYQLKQVRVDLMNKDGTFLALGLPPRNISRSGIGLIAAQFVYKGTPALVHLVSLQNQVFQIPGQIVRCRYIISSPGLYELGVKFDRAIDLAVFHRSPPAIRLLIQDSSEEEPRAIEQAFKGNLVEYKHIVDIRAVEGTIQEKKFDLILMDTDKDTSAAAECVGKLRRSGVWTPIAAMTASRALEQERTALTAGFSSLLVRPVNKKVLSGVVGYFLRDPILSPLTADKEAMPQIEDFVGSIPRLLSETESALAEKNAMAVARVLALFVGESEATGFQLIGRVAREFLSHLNVEPDPMYLRQQMNELVAVCMAARGTGCYT